MSFSDLEITDYSTYEKILKDKYDYSRPTLNLSIGFYGFFSYQPTAWDYVLQSIRNHYPSAPIVLFNDGMDQFDYSEMAKKYNCFYVKKEREICLHWPDIEGAYEFLNRTKEACELTKTDWMIQLHPDVICQGTIKYFPNAHIAGVGAGSSTGKSSNNWDSTFISPKLKEVETYIRKFQPNIELNGWGFCGGSIFHIASFMNVYDSVIGKNKKFDLEEIKNETWNKVTEHEDTLLSILFALNGYIYRIWKDNPEYHRNLKDGAFLHGYKEHYDFKKEKLTDAQYFKKCMKQNIEKRKQQGLLKDDNYLKLEDHHW